MERFYMIYGNVTLVICVFLTKLQKSPLSDNLFRTVFFIEKIRHFEYISK